VLVKWSSIALLKVYQKADMDLSSQIEKLMGESPSRLTRLHGGCVAEVHRADLDSGRVVVKVGNGIPGLALEGRMLKYLSENSTLPVPEVFHASDDLLIMAFIETDGAVTAKGEMRAAELVAALHSVTHSEFGFHEDTLIGGLHQPNPETDSWVEFFAEHRLMDMGRRCVEAGQMDIKTLGSLEDLCARLNTLISPTTPALIHGDMWGGNVLFHQGQIAAFIDPAIYFADPEIELAFTTLFTTFGDAFYKRYNEIRPIADGFWEIRKDLYNLFPLLVHVRLFGGGYLGSVRRILSRLM